MDFDKINKLLVDFCEKDFGSYLSPLGFKLTEKFVTKDGMHLTFENLDREINIYSRTHPLDYPQFWNINLILNDGEFTKSNFRKVPLWSLKKALNPGSASSDYKIADTESLKLFSSDRLCWEVKAALTDLQKYNAGFLTDNLSEFKRLRKLRIDKASR